MAPPAPSATARNLSVFVILFGAVLVQMSRGINAVVLPVSLARQGASSFEIGLCLSLDALGTVVLSRYIARILSRLQLLRALCLAALVWALALALLSAARAYGVWLMAMLCYGSATYVFLISLQTWLNMLQFPRYKGLVVGVYSGTLSLGMALGPLVVRLVGAEGRDPFAINILISAAAVAPLIASRSWLPVLRPLRAPRVLFLVRMAPDVMGSALVGGVAFWGLPAFLTLFGARNNLSVGQASTLITAFMLGSISIGLLVSVASDFVPRRLVIVACIFVGLVCAMYLPIAIYTYGYALALLFVWGGVMGGGYAVALTVVGEVFPERYQVGANAGYSLMDCVGGVLGTMLIGAAMDLLGSEGLVYVIVAAAVVYFIYSLSLREVR